MSNHDLFCFKLMVARTTTERGLVALLDHIETRAADLRQTPIEKERTTEAVAYVRSRIAEFRALNVTTLYPVPSELREAA